MFSTIDIDFNLMKLFSFESRRKDVQEGGKHTTTILRVQKKSIHTTHVFVNIIIINIVTFSLFS